MFQKGLDPAYTTMKDAFRALPGLHLGPGAFPLRIDWIARETSSQDRGGQAAPCSQG